MAKQYAVEPPGCPGLVSCKFRGTARKSSVHTRTAYKLIPVPLSGMASPRRVSRRKNRPRERRRGWKVQIKTEGRETKRKAVGEKGRGEKKEDDRKLRENEREKKCRRRGAEKPGRQVLLRTRDPGLTLTYTAREASEFLTAAG